MDEKELSLLHCIFFIYNTFATFSDGKLIDRENEVIIHFIKRWAGGDEDLTRKVLNETSKWANENIKEPKQAIQYMSSMVDFINEHENFNTHKKEIFLLDLRNISRIDGHFHEAEKKWHDLIAQQLQIPIRISNHTQNQIQREVSSIEKRKPIGFRMSWQQ